MHASTRERTNILVLCDNRCLPLAHNKVESIQCYFSAGLLIKIVDTINNARNRFFGQLSKTSMSSNGYLHLNSPDNFKALPIITHKFQAAVIVRSEGFDISDKDARNPLLYSSMLEHTKTQHRAMGAVGKAAQKVIDERRAVQRSKKGEKVRSVVVARVLSIGCVSVQRLSLYAPKLAAELAQSPPGAPKSERMVRSFMFSPQPRNLAARPSSASSASPASASSSSAAAAPPAIDVDSLCLPDRDEGVHFCLLVV